MKRHRGPRSITRTIAAVLLATPAHLISLGIVALGVRLVWPGTGLWFAFLGVLCLLFAGALVLRPVRRRPEETALELQHAANTVALLREVAAAVRSPLPRRLAVSGTYAVEVRPGRRGRVLSVGAPLWVALDGEERIALLARRLALVGSARTRADAYVDAALWTLSRWQVLLEPPAAEDSRAIDDPIALATRINIVAQRAQYRLGLDLLWLLFLPLRLVIVGYQRLLRAVAAPLHEVRAREADEAAVAAGGAAALPGLDRALEDGEVIATLLQQAARGGTDLQAAVAQRTARLASAHPAMAGVVTATPGSVRVVPEQWTRIDQEWAAAITERFEQLRRDLR